jgi:hypothetical protein
MPGNRGFKFDAVFLFLPIALIVKCMGNCIHGNVLQLRKISPLDLVSLQSKDPSLQSQHPRENQRSSRLRLVGTIPCSGKMAENISWSPNGRYLAVTSGQNVSIWRLPVLRSEKSNSSRSAKSETSEKRTGEVCAIYRCNYSCKPY